MKYIIVIILAIVFLVALINFVKLAQKATLRQLLAMALDLAYLPSSLVIVLWLLGVI